MKNEIKKATNIEEQISKLVERGMVIEDTKKAREYLLDIGYFRLGFYWFPFEKTYPRKKNRNHPALLLRFRFEELVSTLYKQD